MSTPPEKDSSEPEDKTSPSSWQTSKNWFISTATTWYKAGLLLLLLSAMGLVAQRWYKGEFELWKSEWINDHALELVKLEQQLKTCNGSSIVETEPDVQKYLRLFLRNMHEVSQLSKALDCDSLNRAAAQIDNLRLQHDCGS